MTTIINHDLRVHNGRTIMMPAWKGGQVGFGNLSMPDIRDVDTVQKYPVGTKLLDNERVFYYAKAAGNGITHTALACKQKYHQAVGFRAITAAQVAGDTEIKFVTASPDGYGGAGTVTENELAGGFIVVFPGSNDEFVSRIVSNTAAATASMTVTLQDEIPTAVAIGEHAECIANQFLNLETGSDETTPVAGVAHVQVTAGYWFWVQTWGPVWGAPAGGILAAANQIEVRFMNDGALRDEDSTYNEGHQRAGYCLAQTGSGTGQGAPFYFLQITP